MLSILEKFLFENFRRMPAWVRVTSYLVMLVLFVYLALVPRFVDGQLVIKDPHSGGHVPYRGAQLQMQVEGRIYKFSANEEGFWSVPIVSRLPVGLEIQVFHEDLGQWFLVGFTGTQLWQLEAHRIEVSETKPYVQIARTSGWPLHLAQSWPDALVPQARAELILPQTIDRNLAPAERHDLRRSVAATVADVTGKDSRLITPRFVLNVRGAPSYFTRVKIIGAIEKAHGIAIPDEHWRSMETAGDLMQYVKQRVLLKRALPQLEDSRKNWPALQQSLPPEQRPVYRR